MKKVCGILKCLPHIILSLLLVYSVSIDFVYAGCINCRWLETGITWLKGWLTPIGFSRSSALRLLQGSIGIAVTVIVFILNWGVDLFKHSERKVFGISWGELQSDKFQKRGHKLKFGIMLIMPLLIIGAIILELCATSYTLLLWSYYLICGKYWDFAVSYDKRVQREKVVHKLISYIDGEKDCMDDNLADYCSTLEIIREGIREIESWNNAWFLFDDFLKEIMEFERDKCFKLSGYFFEVIFNVPAEDYVQKELIFVKRYMSRIETDDDSQNTVLWSLLCHVSLQWKPEVMESFLSWFIDLPRRSSQRVLCKLEKLEPCEIQRQSAVILVMLEYWMCMHTEDIDVSCEYIDKINEYGKVFLQEESDEHKQFLQGLDDIYIKRFGSNAYKAGEELYSDARYHLNNTKIMTKLNYRL